MKNKFSLLFVLVQLSIANNAYGSESKVTMESKNSDTVSKAVLNDYSKLRTQSAIQSTRVR